VAAADDAIATPRATASVRPSAIIAPPVTQNGKGSQLVPLGSRRGAWANASAIDARA